MTRKTGKNKKGRPPKERPKRYFAADFETTVYDGQKYTEVWASGCAEFNAETENAPCKIFGSIEDQFDYFKSLNCDLIVYYHNLKFDGHFWLDYLLRHGFEIAVTEDIIGDDDIDFYIEKHITKEKLLKNYQIAPGISSAGLWYFVKIKVNNFIIELRDSLKLIPFPLKKAAADFQTAHQKLDMIYEGERFAGCPISESERRYLENDVLALKECLEIIFARGHDRLTIGSCCMEEYKKFVGGSGVFDATFPDLSKIPFPDSDIFEDFEQYIRKSYRGGWVYCDPRNKERPKGQPGITLDVNSLYPSVMWGKSGNIYPFGQPRYFKGKIPDVIATDKRFYYFQRLKCRFRIKPDHLPFIQLKNTMRFIATEYLTTSAGHDGKDDPVELTLTMSDLQLLFDQYEVRDIEYLDCVVFWGRVGMFDDYIEHYKKLKMEATNKADRTIAKLFLNNLYGKFAGRRDSSFKLPTLGNYFEDILSFQTVQEATRRPGYIAVGAAVTSYARNFTIRAAQKNYTYFAYADTDSLHLFCRPEDVTGCPIHDSEFLNWKCEAEWTDGRFIRAKTYAEKTEGKWALTCAGLPSKGKKLFLEAIGQPCMDTDEIAQLDENEKNFIKKGLSEGWSIDNFNIGVCIPGKLFPKIIPGGIILEKTSFYMH